MRFLTIVAAVAFLAPPAMAASPAATGQPARVEVRFTAPERFTDATYENRPGSREQVTRDLAAYLVALGERHVPRGQHLDLEVLDVDLAGQYEPWQRDGQNVRFMRDVTWPRISFRYRVLDESGAVVASGEENVNDMQYLIRPGTRFDSDPLRYEKVMLEDWFRLHFVRTPA